jgi:hypothetical protein
MQEVIIKRLNDTLRYNDLAEAYGGWGLVFFCEDGQYPMSERPCGPRKIVRVWLTDHNVQNYHAGHNLMIIDDSRDDMKAAPRALARIIAAVNPKMAKRMGDTVKDALRKEGLRADTLIDVVDRQTGNMAVNGQRAA